MMVGANLAGWRMAMEFKGSHFELETILWGVRWYVAYPISYRQLEEMMGERGRCRSFDAESLDTQVSAAAREGVRNSQAAGGQ